MAGGVADGAPPGVTDVDLVVELRGCAGSSRAAAARLIELRIYDAAARTAAMDCADVCTAALAVHCRIPQGRPETVYAMWVAVQQAAGVCAELTHGYARTDAILAQCLAACQRIEHAADQALTAPEWSASPR